MNKTNILNTFLFASEEERTEMLNELNDIYKVNTSTNNNDVIDKLNEILEKLTPTKEVECDDTQTETT